jgi:hypothetical protein
MGEGMTKLKLFIFYFLLKKSLVKLEQVLY